MKPKQTKFFKDMICETIEHRRKMNHRENDLIDLMLDCIKESENKEGESKNENEEAGMHNMYLSQVGFIKANLFPL